MMNGWLDFLVTVVVRFVCGAVIGGVASVIFGFRTVMRGIADGDLPIERFVLWGAAGGVICLCTTPREMWPWTKT